MAGRPKKIQPAIITTNSKASTMTLPKPKALAESLGIKSEDIKVLIENSECEGEITINKNVAEMTNFAAELLKEQGNPIIIDGNDIAEIWICHPPVDKIMEKYLEKCSEGSDINLLLPKIFEIASECSHCTEFGVRRPTSTYALLAAKPKRVVSYDIGRWDDVDEVESLCAEAGQDFQFITQNVLEAHIEQTDMLLVDSYHSFAQADAELQRHAHKVNKYILFHDTAEYAYRWKSEPWYPGVADFMNCPEGLYPAIESFLRDNPNWELFFETDINNGLTILKRN